MDFLEGKPKKWFQTLMENLILNNGKINRRHIKWNAKDTLNILSTVSLVKRARIHLFETLEGIESVPMVRDVNLLIIAYAYGDETMYFRESFFENYGYKLAFLQNISNKNVAFENWHQFLPDWMDRIFHDVNLEMDSKFMKSGGDKPRIRKGGDENVAFLKYICEKPEYFAWFFEVSIKLIDYLNKPKNQSEELMSRCEFLIKTLLAETVPFECDLFHRFLKTLFIRPTFHRW